MFEGIFLSSWNETGVYLPFHHLCPCLQNVDSENSQNICFFIGWKDHFNGRRGWGRVKQRMITNSCVRYIKVRNTDYTTVLVLNCNFSFDRKEFRTPKQYTFTMFKFNLNFLLIGKKLKVQNENQNGM